ncbi:MAG: DUF11 domain-containing protein [Gammaproteobacteria bacterium]|nr:DUF11 domain-containing protein [Gammaproteobacteria bacterium]MBU1481147.1 DUF11 domain-containing protein [Gammaproteobacteria bacterium]
MRPDLQTNSNPFRRFAQLTIQALCIFLILGSSSAWAALGASVTLVSGQPTDIFPGETTQLQITLSNSNTLAPITAAGFSNSLPGTLPNGLKIAGTMTVSCTDPAGPTTAPGVGTATAVLGTQAISLANEVIPARANNTDGTCTIVIPVTAGTSSGNAATYAYTIADGAVTGNDGAAVANSGTVNQSVNVRAFAQPTITKNFAASTLVLGSTPTTLTITVTNTNTVAIPNFNITDTFPVLGAGGGIIRVAPGPVTTATCNNGGAAPVFAPVVGAKAVTAGGTIPARSGVTNGSCTFTVQVEADHTNGAYTTNAQTNIINRSTQFTNDIGIPAAANATANITVRSPLRVTKSVNNGALATGQAGAFTITLYNDGPTPLTADFTDDPIDGIGNLTYGLTVTGASTTCAGGTAAATVNNTGVSLTGGTIPATGSCSVTINFTGTVQTANTPRSYTNTLAQGAVNVGNAAIVSQAASAAVTVYENLNISKSMSPTNAVAGNPVRYQVTVQNWSAADITDAAITDTLANGQTFLTGTLGANTYTPSLSGTGCAGLSVSGAVGATAPVFTIGTLPQRNSINSPGSCTVTFWAMTATTASAYANNLAAGSVCYNNGTLICNGGNSNTVSGSSVGVNALSVAKTFSQGGTTNPPSVLARAEGTVVRMTLTFSNLSANPLTGVTVSDTLPTSAGAQMRIATPANAATTCGGSPVITAVANSTSVAMNGATIPARAGGGTGAAGSCLLQVDVVGPAGTYNNTATATGTETYGDASTHTVGPMTSNTATLTYTSALSATKTFAPASVSSGGKSTVTVRLNNSGAVALGSVAVTDPLPTGMVLSNPPNAYTTCAGTTTVTAAAGANTISMSGASIAGAGNCDLVFDVTATGSANWVNTIPVGNITASGGVSNQTAVVGTLTYAAPIGITVAKATNPSTLTFPGELSQLTITLNNGSQAVSGLGLTDYFTTDGTAGGTANGMAIAPTSAASTTCPGGVVSATAGATSVGLSGVSMAASASCTVTVNVTSTSVGGITNYIPVGSIATNQGLTNSGQASTSLTTQSNIGVAKQFTPNVVTPGTRSRLRITFYNPTAQPGTNIAVTDNLPAGVTVPSGANPQTTCVGASVTAPVNTQVQVSGGSIVAASGGVAASCYAEIDVVAATQGDYVNIIPAGTVTASVGGTTASNSQPASDTLRVKQPVVIHTAFSGMTLDAGNPAGFTTGSDSKAPGAPAVMTIRLDNSNAADLTAAAFTDTLPTGLVVGTTPNASTTCVGGTVVAAASGTSVRLSGATIPATGFCTVTVNVLSNISASYTNTIAAGAVTTYEGVSNTEPTSAQLFVSTPPTVSKQFAPSVIPPNGISTLTIVLGNSNTGAVTLTSAFVDTLPTAPGNILVAATPNVVKTCPGAVTATAGSGTITYANGASIPAGGCTISVDVTGATPGDHTNNIPAGTLVTNFGNNQQPANAVLTVSTLAYVSGRVFLDNNVTPNGTFESGTDTPVQGVSIELHSGANCSGALVSAVGLTNPVTTDVLGNYMFAGLSAGTYSVCEPVQPAGTSNGTTTAGAITSVNGSTGTPGVASNPTSTTSQVVNIVLNGDGASAAMSGTSGNNFAEIVPSSISGTVFLDQNNNGVQNGADTGIAGVSIELLDNANAVVSTTSTDASGNYSFTGLLPGNYAVREPSQPAGTSNGITTAGAVGNGGTPGSVTGVTTVPSVIGSTTKITLPPNTASTGNNFADIPNGRSLSGRVFLDYDNNGLLDGPDHGIGQQTINLTGSDINGNPVTVSTTTVSTGTYSFTGLPEGTYTVTEPVQPAGTTNGITSAGSTGGTATTVGVTPSAISGISLLGANTVSADNNFADVPGAAVDLAISKTHSPASFGENSSTGYFTITPSNIGTLATSGTVTIVDALPTGMTVAAAATGSGWTCSGAVGATTVTCTSTDAIAAGGGTGNPITLRVLVANGLAGQILINTAVISGGNEPAGFDSNNTATDPVVISTTANVSGSVWYDANHNRVLDAGETSSTLIAGWQVELLLGGVQVASATTASDGSYSFTGVAPGSGYTLRFRHPETGSIWGSAVANEQGIAPVSGTRDNATAAVSGTNSGNPAGATLNGDGTLSGMTLFAGDNIVQQSLPLDPAGVVYDSVTRNPVSGAVVTLSGPAGFTAADVVGGSLSQTTGADGLYQFLLNAGAPSGTYTLAVTGYPGGYLPVASMLIPACSNTLSVNNVPSPALVQATNTAPAAAATVHDPATCPASTAGLNATNQASTQYYYSFNLSTTAPLSANVVNNHIAIDPILGGAIALSKKTPLVNVSRGDLVPYTITATNTLSATLSNIDLRDQLPPGFKYKVGTASLDGVPTEPAVSGRVLTWPNLTFTVGQSHVIRLTTVVGAGVSEGTYVNQAYALNNIVDAPVSNTATATVRVVPDPTFDCSDVIGKVFDDKNINGYQDAGEPGIANIRLATVNGLLVTTDAEGRYHVTCAMVPNEMRGSNFLMKLDERTLPTGFRVTTENPRDVRLTRGKIGKLNFGATIHRVVRLDVTDAAYTSDALKAEWQAKLDKLPELLKQRPSVLRLGYKIGADGEETARKRLKALSKEMRAKWKAKDCCHLLQIEEELIQPSVAKQEGR